MEVKINKEIRNFKESIFFGLSLRQFVCAVLAVVTSVGLYFLLGNLLGSSEVGWICVLGAAPFALLGFFRYHGLPLERVALSWFRSQILIPSRLHFRAKNERLARLRASARKERRKPPRNSKTKKKKEGGSL